MSLLEDLRNLRLPPSHLPTINEISQLLGSVIAFVEHGEDLLKAGQKDVEALEAGEDAPLHVDKLLSPPPPDEPEPPAAGAPASPAPPATVPDSRDEEIANLRQQLATAQAQTRRTEASVTSDEPKPEPPVAGV